MFREIDIGMRGRLLGALFRNRGARGVRGLGFLDALVAREIGLRGGVGGGLAAGVRPSGGCGGAGVLGGGGIDLHRPISF